MFHARRRQMARLEKLGEPYFEQLAQRRAEEQKAWAARARKDALIHAANFSLILLYGEPKIGEPLVKAWERCRESTAPELSCEAFQRIAKHNNPFDDELDVELIAIYFRRNILKTLPGESELQKLGAIFETAPPWYIWFTWARVTADVLDFEIPDLSKILRFKISAETYLGWPRLPAGPFEKRPWPDAFLRKHPKIRKILSAIQDDAETDQIQPRPSNPTSSSSGAGASKNVH
jgi:hypothetical protein